MANIEHFEDIMAEIRVSRTRFHIDIPPLHPENINAKCKHADEQTGSGAPPDDGRANQVILALHIGPGAHTQAEPQQRPIAWHGCEDVFLVGVRDKRVIRCHHRDV